MSRTLILGLGNPLSGDDGFGARVLERLHQNGLDLLPDVALADAHTDLLNHIEEFAGYEQVILVDAVLDPEEKLGAPGRVGTVEEETFSAWSGISQSAHQMTPLMGIKLFRLLNPAAKTRIRLVGLFVDHLEHAPVYATDDRIAEAASAIQLLLATDYTD